MRIHERLVLLLLAGFALFVYVPDVTSAQVAQAIGDGRTLFLPLVVLANPSPTLAGCAAFPGNNIWNQRVDQLPIDIHSDDYIASIGPGIQLHPDFGKIYGIPFTSVPVDQEKVPISFGYPLESDPGPYPIPVNAPVEGGSDRHVLVVQRDTCQLYEMFNAQQQPNGSWYAGSGAVFDLNSNILRPKGWTSADAAGLPILPGLVRYDEVADGQIRHALRFTAQNTRRAYIWPARHYASDITSVNVPPMGQRFRLKAGVDISGYPYQIQVIFRAFKEYGIILADNGSNWYITGAPDSRWDDEQLVDAFRTLDGSDFEAVDASGLMINSDSGQSK